MSPISTLTQSSVEVVQKLNENCAKNESKIAQKIDQKTAQKSCEKSDENNEQNNAQKVIQNVMDYGDLESMRKAFANLSLEERAIIAKYCEEDGKRRARESAQQLQLQTLSGRIKFATIPSAYKEVTLADCRSEVINFAEALKAGIYTSIILRGSVGTGKTKSGCAVLNEFIRTKSVKYMTFGALVRNMSDVYIHRVDTRQDLIDRVSNVSVLMIDDLGKELAGSVRPDKAITLLWELIDYRHANELPTIITTQYDGSSLAQLLTLSNGDTSHADAIMDRLRTYQSVVFSGESKRNRPDISAVSSDPDGTQSETYSGQGGN